jgi:predicted O-methyltransferase YrrM
MDALQFLASRYNLDLNQKQLPIEIPNTDRNTLAQIFYALGYSIGAEIGVESGKYSEVLLSTNPRLQLYCIDSWEVYAGYREHMDNSEMEDLLEETKERLKGYIEQQRCIVLKGFSTQMAKEFRDESLDFVYLDANHEFPYVVEDIAAWEKKVKVGGIVAGHDYIRRKGDQYNMQVPFAVNGYTAAYGIRPFFVLGRKEKIEGELRERTRSWFYVKPPRT